MSDRRIRNAEIFEDTAKMYTENSRLADAVKHSAAAQRFISANEKISLPPCEKTAALSESEWQTLNIVTCAAPNLRQLPQEMEPSELERLLEPRIRRIFEAAAADKNEVLILGAFGCGAFRNPPEIVSNVFGEVMRDFLCRFETIEYAVFHTEREIRSYTAFKRITAG